MVESILINGKPDDKLSVLDRGLQYGDGLFETIAVYKGNPLCWDEHIDRLILGCKRLSIPEPDQALLLQEASYLIKTKKRAVLKIIITRGQGDRGYVFLDEVAPTRIVTLYHVCSNHSELDREQGIQLRLCHMRYSQNPVLAGIKHLNRLEQIMARSEWNDINIHEGLVLDHMNNVIEGTMSNIFYVKEDTLFTPKLNLCGIAGIVRRKIIENSSKFNMEILIKKTTVDDLLTADEVFMCNSIIGIWPVKQFEQKEYRSTILARQINQMLIKWNVIMPTC